MIEIHQAMYGAVGGGYGLIRSTFENESIPTRIGNSTDVIDRPNDGPLNAPIFRAFCKDDYFLFIKSFPDDSADRKGRFFSHVLIVNRNDLGFLNDLTKLREFLADDIDKDAVLYVIEFDERDNKHFENTGVTEASRIGAAMNAIVQHNEHKNAILWEGEEGYFEMVCGLWRNLTGELRSTLKLGAAFNPKKVKQEFVNIQYIPSSQASNWERAGFEVITVNQMEVLDCETAIMLSGRQAHNPGLKDMVEDFGVPVREIDDYVTLEAVSGTYRNLSNERSVTRVALLVDLISKMSPDVRAGIQAKNALLQRFEYLLDKSDAVSFLKIRSISVSGFADASNRLSRTVNKWASKNLMASEDPKSTVTVATTALEQSKASDWWVLSIVEVLKTSLEGWNADYSKTVLEWFRSKPDSIAIIGALISDKAEKDLIRQKLNLTVEMAQELLKLSEKKSWLCLHAHCLLKLHSPRKAVRLQLKFDTNSEHFGGVNVLAMELEGKKLVDIAVQERDDRLVEVAARRIDASPDLMEDLDVEDSTWQLLWLKAVSFGMDVWSGISEPKTTLYSLLDQLDSSDLPNLDLLAEISKSSDCSLANYPRRKMVWSKLPAETTTGLLAATALDVLVSDDDLSNSIPGLEKELSDVIRSNNFCTSVLMNPSVSVSAKVSALGYTVNQDETTVTRFILATQFNLAQAARLGKLVQERRWSAVAKSIYDSVDRRADLRPALAECNSILNFFQRALLRSRGYKKVILSDEEWRSEFEDMCCRLYGQGPNTEFLWTKAGGMEADLLLHTNGRAVWHDALDKIQRGAAGEITYMKLIEKMIENHPFDQKLIALAKYKN